MKVIEAYDKLFKHLAIKRTKKRNLKWKSTGKLFPSSSGVGCELQLRYDFLGEEKEIDFVWHGCENIIGNAVHKWIQDNFIEQFGNNVEIEKYVTKIVEGLKINAKIDIILKKKTIIEIKTVKDTEGKEPKKKDIAQVQWYMGVLGLDKAILSYFRRENGIHINSFEIPFDQGKFDRIVEKFAKVIRGDKNLRSDIRECGYCNYKVVCPNFSKKFVKSYRRKSNGKGKI